MFNLDFNPHLTYRLCMTTPCSKVQWYKVIDVLL